MIVRSAIAVPRNRSDALAPPTPLSTYRPPSAPAAVTDAHDADAVTGDRRVPFASAIASTPVPVGSSAWVPASVSTAIVWVPRPRPVNVRGIDANEGRSRSIRVRNAPSISTFVRPNEGPAIDHSVTDRPRKVNDDEAPGRRSNG